MASMRLIGIRGCRPLAALIVVAALACSAPTGVRSGGVPCGRNQHAFATVTLPDTGIDAGREMQVSFIQHDPDAGELSEVVVQQSWPASMSFDSEPDPRVRLLDASGKVFVDTLGTRFSSGSLDPTWYVLHWLKDAQSRNALYDAFASQSLWLELWRASATAPGMRVPLTTKEYGVYPPELCL
jgi:hypothetical protein